LGWRVLLLGVAWATVGLWLIGALLTLRGLRRQPPLRPVRAYKPGGDKAPLVSVLVPARNEERRVLDRAVRSMLAQDYANLEVVAVNDRSVDATGPILRALAREDGRLRVVEGVEPPAGWLGKPHALRQAYKAARGAWVLATDADVIFAPEAAGTALKLALEEGYDAVTFIPRVECLTFWERVFMPTFGWFMMLGAPPERVNDPRRPEAVGVGGFFLIRRAALECIGGYAAVRGEVAEDLRTAELLKRAGARLRIEYAPDLVRTRMQTSLAEIWEGFTKNLFAGLKFSRFLALAGSSGVFLFSVLPALVALVCAALRLAGAGGEFAGQLFLPASAVWLVQALTFAAVNRATDVPALYGVAAPLGHALFVAILLNSTARVLSGRGVTWKGRAVYARRGVAPPSRRASGTCAPVADEQPEH
jgi:chlorobactene glucosyltransferase